MAAAIVTRALIAIGFAVAAMLGAAVHARAAEPELTIRIGGQTRTYSTGELLGRAGPRTIAISYDVSYRRPMRYRAIPLAELLAGLPYREYDVMQAVATDNFVAEIPMTLFAREDAAIPWIAIDDPREPWPNMPNKDYTGGPFYLVWQNPERSKIMSEQWVSNLASLTGMESAVKRWPQLNAGASASAEVRLGMHAYITQCLPCHQLYGAGSGTSGPDLGRPMNATTYLTDRGLRALIRDPRSVRSWPKMSMPGFPPTLLPDETLNAIVLYLKYKAESPPR